MNETIVWQRADDVLPAPDTPVLVCFQDVDVVETYIGVIHDDIWVDLHGLPFEDVLAWAPLPKGPIE